MLPGLLREDVVQGERAGNRKPLLLFIVFRKYRRFLGRGEFGVDFLDGREDGDLRSFDSDSFHEGRGVFDDSLLLFQTGRNDHLSFASRQQPRKRRKRKQGDVGKQPAFLDSHLRIHHR